MKKLIKKICTRVLLLLLVFSFVIYTSFLTLANSRDSEFSSGNHFSADTLDLTLSAEGSDFTPDPNNILPGDTVSRNLYLGNSGSIELEYRGAYEYNSGNSALCNGFLLDVSEGGVNIYSGSLSGFTAFASSLVLANGDTDTLLFEITLPVGADTSLSEQTCGFNFNFIAWQSDLNEGEGFRDEESLAVSLTTGDFQPPSVPILEWPIDDEVTNDNSPLMQWQDSTDNVGIAGYYYRIYIGSPLGSVWPNTTGLFIVPSQLQAGSTPDNDYYWQVRAEDVNGNQSDWSELEHFTIDTTAPLTSFFTSNSPKRQIKDDVLNGDFDGDSGMGGLDHWTATGNVTVLQTDSAGGDLIDPNDIYGTSDNNHMVRVMPSTTVDSSGELYYSSLSQPIPNSAKTLSFWYNFATSDDVLDSPGFSIYLNNQEVFQVWAEDINFVGGATNTSDWQKFYYDLDTFDMGVNPILTLIFYSGNTGDDQLDSWVYLDKISTQDAYVNDKTLLYLEPSDASEVEIYYLLGPCEETVGKSYKAPFDLSEPTLDNKFCYWSVDEVGNTESKHQVTLIYDDKEPDAIDDLSVTPVGDGQFMLDWTAVDPIDPIGNQTAAYYLLKYSQDGLINDANFDSKADYQTQAPRSMAEAEHLEVSGLSPGVEYYFALKSCDSASNCSDLIAASVVSATSGDVDPLAGGTKEVIINEIMWMGSETSTNDEWIELYNTTDAAIDLEEWQIVKKRSDGIEQCMYTFKAGDIIGPGQYIIISEYDQDHSAINVAPDFVAGEGDTNDHDFALANSQLQVKLYDGYWTIANLIDVADDGVGAPAAGSYDSGTGIYHSMERNADWGNGADPENWHSCDDSGSNVYWDLGLTGEHWGTPGVANMSETRPLTLPVPLLDSLTTSLDNQGGASQSAVILETKEASPTAQVEVSFEPSPLLTPSPSPQATVSPNPEPSVSPSPLASPEASLSPEPSPVGGVGNE